MHTTYHMWHGSQVCVLPHMFVASVPLSLKTNLENAHSQKIAVEEAIRSDWEFQFEFQVGVSKNRGGSPKSSILIGFSIINQPSILGYHYFWKHPSLLSPRRQEVPVLRRSCFPAAVRSWAKPFKSYKRRGKNCRQPSKNMKKTVPQSTGRVANKLMLWFNYLRSNKYVIQWMQCYWRAMLWWAVMCLNWNAQMIFETRCDSTCLPFSPGDLTIPRMKG